MNEVVALSRRGRAALGLCFAAILGLVAALQLGSAGCDSSGSGTPAGTSGAGGGTSTSGTGGTGGDLAAEVCPGACATAKTCMLDRLELAACEAQCALELAGSGYLVQEIAVQYFQSLLDAGQDTDCEWTRFGKWMLDPTNLPAYELTLAEPAVLSECVDVTYPCWGPPIEYHEEGCFMNLYRHNEARRNEVRTCFAVSCMELSECMCLKQPPGHPWIAVGADPPGPLGGC
jgi:hypothetical protein